VVSREHTVDEQTTATPQAASELPPGVRETLAGEEPGSQSGITRSARIGRVFLLLAAVALLVIQSVQAYVSLRQEAADLQKLGESITRSVAVSLSTPLWLLAEGTIRETLRSYVSLSAVDTVLIHEQDLPLMGYDSSSGFVGGVEASEEERSGIDTADFAGPRIFDRVREPIRFEGDVIGNVELFLNDQSVRDARRASGLGTLVVVIAEILIVVVIMRLRGNQIQTASLSQVNESLRRFVPNQFLSFLHRDSITDIRLGDHSEQFMSVMFVDIRSFTSLSEDLSTEENFAFINSFFGKMGPVIRRHGGFIDKYVGDGIMALFPSSINDAVAAAVDLRRELRSYNRDREIAGDASVDFGVGIHAGDLMLGTVGEHLRMDSTVISSAVNLAARLEGITKDFGAGVVISELVAEQVGKETWEMRYLGNVSVKGSRLPIDVYEVFEGESDEARELRGHCKESFEAGVAAAVQGDYPAAVGRFRDALHEFPDDPAVDYYLKQLGGV